MSSKKALIFSAPSGAGKTTIVKHLLKEMPSRLSFSISACSRSPRNNETDKKDYYFLSVDEFKQGIANQKFLEWEEVYPNMFYGTLLEEVERIWSNGKAIVFDVDVKGGIALKQYFGDKALSVFVSPPSLEVLGKRLRNRKTETEEEILKRINKAEEEMTDKDAFDMVLINEDLDTTCQQAMEFVGDFLEQ